MHIIAKRKFAEAAKKHPRYADAILETYQVLNKNNFRDAHVLQRTLKAWSGFVMTGMLTLLTFPVTIWA